MSDAAPDDLAAKAALIRSSGLFDETAYRAKRPRLPASEDAALHYLTQGFLAPGPLFDPRAYLRAYPDVRAAGLVPLLHYLEAGRAEGRKNVFPSPRRVSGRGWLIAPLPAGRAAPVKLAVVVRVIDLAAFAEICAALKNIPGKFSLWLAVADQPAEEAASAAARAAGLSVDECVVAPAPDLGALVTTFADDVLRHDFLLHLVARADGAFGATLGSAPLVDTMLTAFREHPRLGLIYPDPPPAAPTWSQWSRSAFAAEPFMARWNLDWRAGRGHVAYPIGADFWARVDAIRPLLEAGMTPADLPEKAGHPRPSKVGALNRVLGAVARGRGFSFVERDRLSGEMRLDWVSWDIDPQFTRSVQDLIVRARDADLVSFDIFDTVLLRGSAAAGSVLAFVGLCLERDQAGAAAATFVERRRRAEFAARGGKGGDVGLKQIYRQFERDEIFTDQVVAAAHALELDSEARLLGPRPGIAAVLEAMRAAGKRVIALSDTYFSEAQVRAFLSEAGLERHFDALYVSSEQGARKDRGDLWDKVRDAEDANPARWLHIGDNERADIDTPSKRGIACELMMQPRALARAADLILDAPMSGWGADLALGPAVNALAGEAAPGRSPGMGLTLARPADVGFTVFGPIIFGFLHWIVNHHALASVTMLNFLAREGFVLHQAYEAVRALSPSRALPPGHYLYASRRAALGANLGASFDPAPIVCGAAFRGTMLDLLQQRIGFDASGIDGDLTRTVSLPGDEARAMAAIAALEPQIAAHAARELSGYRGYLKQVGFSDSAAPALVDIGYSGTIQAALQGIEARPLTGFYLGLAPQARQVEQNGGRAYGYLAEFESIGASAQPALGYCLLMESFLIAPHGQVASFGWDGGSFAPRFKAPTIDAPTALALTEMQSGAARYCAELLTLYGDTIWDAPVDKRVLQEPFRALVDGVIKIPRELRSLFSVENEFCGVAAVNPLELPFPPWPAP